MTEIVAPFQQFFDTNGAPLANGMIYIGIANLDAETNPIAVFWDDAFTIPAAQPIRTLNGYPARNGAPARLYVNTDDYSITVRNAQNRIVYSIQDVSGVSSIQQQIDALRTEIFDDFAAPSGSSLIGFIQNGVSAVARTAQTKMRDIVSVKDFGAVGDGIIDDQAAIQNAIDSFGTGDVALFLPPGTYRCGAALSVTQASSLAVYGVGLGASVLLFSGGSSGFVITFPTPSSNLMEDQVAIFREVSVQTSTVGGIGIDVSWASAVGDTSVGLSIQNCFIGAQNKNLPQYWVTGVKTNNGRRVYIQNTAFDGQSITTNMEQAIWFAGGTVEAHVNCCDITHAAKGVRITDECEGVFITQTNLVYVGDAVDWQAASSYMGTHFVFDGCHTSAIDNGIVAARLAHAKIANCLIQKREGTGSNYTDLKLLSDCKFWKIHNNHFQLVGTGGTEDGIVIESNAGNQYIHIHNNTFENRDKAIWWKSAVNNIFAHDNIGVNVSTMLQKDGTDGNVFVLEKNFPATNAFKFISGATPSVDQAETDSFLTSNASATTITNFLHGRPGQRILICANDSNTTLQHNVNVNLQGGVNFAMSAGAVVELIWQGNLWREIGRRTP